MDLLKQNKNNTGNRVEFPIMHFCVHCDDVWKALLTVGLRRRCVQSFLHSQQTNTKLKVKRITDGGDKKVQLNSAKKSDSNMLGEQGDFINSLKIMSGSELWTHCIIPM